MKILYVSEDSYYEEAGHIFSKDIINPQNKMFAFLSCREAEKFDANKQAHQFYRQLKEKL